MKKSPTKRSLVLKMKERRASAKQRSPWHDEQSARVYTAEQYGAATTEARLPSKSILTLLTDIIRSPRWKKTWGRTPLRVTFLSRGATVAWGGIYDAKYYRKVKGKKKMYRRKAPNILLPLNHWGRKVHTIIHEMAHCLSSGGHGPKFCRTLIKMTREFEGAYYARELHRRFIETGALERPRRRKK